MDMQSNELAVYQITSKTYVLKFGVECHSVDAELMARSILACKNSICAAAIATEKSGRVRVAVDAVKEGSVEIQMTVSAECVDGNVDPIEETMRVVAAEIDLYRFLGGQPMLAATPMPDGMVLLKNVAEEAKLIDGSVYRAFMANEEPAVGDCSMCDELGVKSISILNEDKIPIAEVRQPDFRNMVRKIATFKNVESSEVVTTEKLRIAVLPLESPRNAWGFVWGNVRISANIKDEDFITKIEKNLLSFYQGDLLKVNLKVEKKIDTVTLKETKCKYVVIKVLETEHRPQQPIML